MEWLSQNWLGIAFGIGLLLLMRRFGMGCGGGHGGSGHRHGAGSHSGRVGAQGDGATGTPPSQAADPVSGRPGDPHSAIASVYRGAPVYFESRANRDQFEASPEQFPITPVATPAAPQHRRGHC